MTQQEFAETVERLESYAAQEPGAYRLRVGLLAALGYGYIFAVLLALVALLYGLMLIAFMVRVNWLIINLGWMTLVLLGLVARSLWVTFPKPEGDRVKAADAPKLFEMVNKLSAEVEAPRVHRILVTNDFNAGIVQRPRLGILGWQENYLLLGLPLLQSLSPEQFRAVLAHELGHLSGKHGRFAGWIYRVRQTWIQLLVRLEQRQHWSAFIFTLFLNWYAPFFNAYSFVLARSQEYEADRRSARIVGTEHIAKALINMEVMSKYLEQSYWPDIIRKADEEAAPPTALTYAQMSASLRTAVKHRDAGKWLRQSLQASTGHEDTHPALIKRLGALKYLPQTASPLSYADQSSLLPAPVSTTAAQFYLESFGETVSTRLDSLFKEKLKEIWRERQKYRQEVEIKLRSLEAKAAKESLSREEEWNRVVWTAELNGSEATIPLLHEILEREPEHPIANYTLGQLLLRRDDETGIAYLEKHMQLDAESVPPACELLYDYYTHQGRESEAEAYRVRAEEQAQALERARGERAGVAEGDKFQPHDLPADKLEALRSQLSNHPDISAAYLVRKEVAHFQEFPFYVLAIAPHATWRASISDKMEEELTQKLKSTLSVDFAAYLIILNKRTAWLKNIVQQMSGAEIYRSSQNS